MKYVVSDLHGMYDKFLELLKIISFNDEDQMYILGDIFDRGDKPIDLIKYIWEHKNIHLIKGNHESMFESVYENKLSLELWIHNGGGSTVTQLNDEDSFFKDKVYEYIKNLPLYLIVDNYLLVHAGLYLPECHDNLTLDDILLMQTEEYLLWDREFVFSEKKVKDLTVIVGHTPVLTINNSPKIIHKDGKILIDSGAVFEKYNGKLSCLCLDNKKEYYI